jgi:hypothetical protein
MVRLHCFMPRIFLFMFRGEIDFIRVEATVNNFIQRAKLTLEFEILIELCACGSLL